MGQEELPPQFSEYATAAVIPGAAGWYGKTFKAMADHRNSNCEESLRGPSCSSGSAFQGRARCQRGSKLGVDDCCQQRQTLV